MPGSSQNQENERMVLTGSWSRPREAPSRPLRCRDRFAPRRPRAACASGRNGSRYDVRSCALRPRSAAPALDVRKLACRSERRSRARIPAPGRPIPSASSAAMGHHRRSAPPRGPGAARFVENSSAPRAGRWPRRRQGYAKCQASPCADSPPPGPSPSTPPKRRGQPRPR